MLAIDARGLAKTYPGGLGRAPHEALRGVDLAVEAGTAFGLIGPNGAGKTTFVKSILGVVRPSGGTARLLGGDPADPRVRARVGYLPERLQFPPALSAHDVLRSVARLKGLGRAGPEIPRRLEEVGLAGAAGRRVGAYSKGMRQRLGLACALLGAPDLLVLDEPTDGLDPLARVEVRGLLAREVARGATVFLNSHLLAETERVCTRVGILVDGRVVREGRLGELREGTSRWRVRFEPGAPEAALGAAGFLPGDAPGRFAFEGEPGALNAALDRARAAGALVVELSRDAKDLEQVLADAVEASA
ncbi:MAG TPA: ABC transporter ATP-binding protein [Anaeromyxobacter sp.]|nr:ABC transporter ATP-binding protein [Anaeromyxobacter sp.]